ncbi:hypothetical protein [Weissella paramesenteroides]|uniref:hypothetical protein n=1 Tax=Weissella paramesenteroides TaxID=1249 RepID=UPI0023F92047|nr:hypothetical protein [Weissella paramesenteroides]MDF8372115.1 hypothetical protein [Weissella paramesenteroides]WIG65908.1 hypothetical protein G9U56_02715 [Weissella paramesenteroides]
MRYADYSEQAFLNHLRTKDAKLMEEAKRIDDPLLRDVMYNMAQIVARFADVEDENVLGASNHLEDELTDLRDNMPVADNNDEIINELSDEVFELKKYIEELEARL